MIISALCEWMQKFSKKVFYKIRVKVLFGIYGGDKVLSVGDTAQLNVNIADSLKSAVNWFSSDTNVVTVDSKGKITAVSWRLE